VRELAGLVALFIIAKFVPTSEEKNERIEDKLIHITKTNHLKRFGIIVEVCYPIIWSEKSGFASSINGL